MKEANSCKEFCHYNVVSYLWMLTADGKFMRTNKEKYIIIPTPIHKTKQNKWRIRMEEIALSNNFQRPIGLGP